MTMAHAEAAAAPRGGARATRAFSPFEWIVALRYLRARRAKSFVSVIAGFSFAGIMLGVATLIVVMSVMNGFRQELLNKIVGINGHVFVQATDTPFTDYDAVAKRLEAVPGVKLVIPMIEGAAGVVLALQPVRRAGARHRGPQPAPPARHRRPCRAGHARRLRQVRRRRHRPAARRIPGSQPRRSGLGADRQGRPDALRRGAAHQELPGGGHLPDRHVGVRLVLRLHADGGSAELLQQGRRGHPSSRSSSTIPTTWTPCACGSTGPSSGRP